MMEGKVLPEKQEEIVEKKEGEELKEEKKKNVLREAIFGVDLGSVKCSVALATQTENFPELVRNSMNNRTTPFVVSFHGSHRYIGEEGATHVSKKKFQTSY